MANKGILITGGSGLVGAYAVGRCCWNVASVRWSSTSLSTSVCSTPSVSTPVKLTMIRGDMADMPALISAIRDHDCDQIIHLAAFLGEEVQRRPYSGVRLNFMGTINVFEAARLENVKRVVFPVPAPSTSVRWAKGSNGSMRSSNESAIGLCRDQGEL